MSLLRRHMVLLAVALVAMLPGAVCADEPAVASGAEMMSVSEMASGAGMMSVQGKPRGKRTSFYKKGQAKRGKGIDYGGREFPDNFISVSLAGGYSALLSQNKITRTLGSGGAQFGFGYEMHGRCEKFWWSVTGELEWLNSSLSIDHQVGDHWINDNEGDLALMRYDIKRWRDRQQMLMVSVPVMFGYRTKKFYIGAGPKLMVCAMADARNTVYYTTSAAYDRYGDDFIEMPNHYYGTFKSWGSGRLDVNRVNVAACFEVGANVLDQTYNAVQPRRRHSFNPRVALKVGFYAEYGFLNMNRTTAGGRLAEIMPDQAHIITTRPFFMSEAMVRREVTPFFAGVKVTLLYTHNCRNCHGKTRVF